MFDCDQCSKKYRLAYKLKRHQRDVHADESLRTCNICGKILISIEGVKYHLKSHHNNENYECDICGWKTKSKSHLKRHLTKCHVDGRQVCYLCKVNFKNQQNLFEHRKVHVGTKQYKCLMCDHKSFAKYKTLQDHVMKNHESWLEDLRKICGVQAKIE